MDDSLQGKERALAEESNQLSKVSSRVEQTKDRRCL